MTPSTQKKFSVEMMMLAKVAPIRPLRNDTEYAEALAEFERYCDDEPAPQSEAADRFELLGMVIAKYEEDQFPIGEPDPIEVIRLVMEGRGLDQSDLARVLGSASRASELLNRRRSLSLDHIRRLSSAWRIPADALLGETV